MTMKCILRIGRDNHNKAVVWQADIKQFHDNLNWKQVRWSMKKRGIPDNLAEAALRIQRATELNLNIQCFNIGRLKRTKGALTGNPLAPLMGWITVEDILLDM